MFRFFAEKLQIGIASELMGHCTEYTGELQGLDPC